MPKFSLKEEISIFRRIKNINNLSKNDKIFSLLKNIRKKKNIFNILQTDFYWKDPDGRMMNCKL